MLRGSSSITHLALSKPTYVDKMPFPSGGSWPRGLTQHEPLRANADPPVVSGAGEFDGAAPHTIGARRSARRLRAVLVTSRPRQWIKNGLVVAAAGAAGALGHDDVPLRVELACAALCLLASGIYAVNDVHDAPEDRRHPRKLYRPVAASDLDPRAALALGAAMILVGLAVCAFVSPLLTLVGAGYVALTLSYTIFWRHTAILDVVAIAGGFVLRAVAGGVAAPVMLSRWFVLVVTFAAVFVAAGKRQAEVRRTAGTDTAGRRSLEVYTTARLRLFLVASASAAVFA
jgi:decaprenyl-phosphate phosphoribosyltransferase